MTESKSPLNIHRQELLKPQVQKLNYVDLAIRQDSTISKDVQRSVSKSFASDVPISDDGDDEFGFTTYAEELATHILSPQLQMPFSLCIDGYWGSGKSSLAKLIFSRLSDESSYRLLACIPVWIDSSLIPEARNVLSYVAAQTLHNGIQIARRVTGSYDQLGTADSPLAPPLFRNIGAESDSLLRAQDNDKKVEDLLKRHTAAWYKKWQDTAPEIWSYESFLKLVGEMRGAFGGGGPTRIVWFIDDLDRCKSDLILEVLRIHRTLLEKWGTVLVYSMDYTIIESVVGKHFREQGGIYTPYTQGKEWDTDLKQGQMYLEKFFSVRLRPPEPSLEHIKRWLIHQLGSECYFEGLERFMQAGYYNNPRYIKRFISNVRFLRESYVSSKYIVGSTWDGLKSLNNDELALSLMTKIAAIALAGHLEGFYESARSPHGPSLKQLESAAKEREPAQCTVETGEVILAMMPNDLEALLLCQPSFLNVDVTVSILESAIRGIDRVLRSPRRQELQVTTPNTPIEDTSGTESGQGNALRTSREDRQRVETIVIEWLSKVEQVAARYSAEFPEVIRHILTSPVSNHAVQVFRSANWNPEAESLINQANYLIRERGDVRTSAWFWCAASVHPTWKEKDIDEMEKYRQWLESIDLAHAFYDVAVMRFPQVQAARHQLAVTLAHAKEKSQVGRGLQMILDLMGISRTEIINDKVTLNDRFSDEGYRELFLAANDALDQLKEANERVAFNRAAFGVTSGQKSVEVVRNLAESLFQSGQAHEANRLFHAAIMMDRNELISCYWAGSKRLNDPRLTNPQEYQRYYMAAVVRASQDFSTWYRAGRAILTFGQYNTQSVNDSLPWFLRAYSLNSTDDEVRNMLGKLLPTIRGGKLLIERLNQGEDVLDDDDRREQDTTALRSYYELILEIIREGMIIFDEVVLFDPNRLPPWTEALFERIRQAKIQ